MRLIKSNNIESEYPKRHIDALVDGIKEFKEKFV